MLFATIPAAPPTRKNQRTTSCPAPISAKVPYQRGSRLIFSALEWVSRTSSFTATKTMYQLCRSCDSYIFVKSELFSLKRWCRRASQKKNDEVRRREGASWSLKRLRKYEIKN